MAYDEGLAQRIREMLDDRPGLSEKRMFGGLCFMLHGHMVVGPMGSELMVRVGPTAYADALSRRHAREMDFTGRSLKGFVYVSEEGIAEDDELRAWLDLAVRHAESLPPKTAKQKASKKQTSKKKTSKKQASKQVASKKKTTSTKKSSKKKKA